MARARAWKSLERAPAFAVAALLSLVLGVASSASMHAIVHGMLLAPLPYGEPDRLVSIGLQSAELRRLKQPPAVHAT